MQKKAVCLGVHKKKLAIASTLPIWLLFSFCHRCITLPRSQAFYTQGHIEQVVVTSGSPSPPLTALAML